MNTILLVMENYFNQIALYSSMVLEYLAILLNTGGNMEIQEIIDSFINGNKQQFYNQIKKYSVEDFFIELRNQVNLGLYEERLFIRMTITYFYYNEKN